MEENNFYYYYSNDKLEKKFKELIKEKDNINKLIPIILIFLK